jgi:hypothetical protein
MQISNLHRKNAQKKSRLGMHKSNLLLVERNNEVEIDLAYSSRTLGEKQYELTNHLGNVLAVITDKKLANNEPDVVSTSDYFPFGMTMPGRMNNGLDYRYGFGSHEKDNEVNSGWYSFGDYGYDARLARRPRLDPIAQISFSNYVVFGDNPIFFVDPTGMKWDKQEDADQLKRDIDTKIESLEKEISTSKNELKKDGLSDDQISNYKNNIAELETRIANLNKSKIDIDLLGDDKENVYVLKEGMSSTNKYGVTQGEDNKVYIATPDVAVSIHEITHVKQSLNAGGLKFNDKKGLNYVNDKREVKAELEIEAYKRQYSYSKYFPGDTGGKGLEGIDVHSVGNIWNKEAKEYVYEDIKALSDRLKQAEMIKQKLESLKTE